VLTIEVIVSCGHVLALVRWLYRCAAPLKGILASFESAFQRWKGQGRRYTSKDNIIGAQGAFRRASMMDAIARRN
jgi:hypothetical protein